MDKLWAKRRKPTPLDWENLPGEKSGVIDDGMNSSFKQLIIVLKMFS